MTRILRIFCWYWYGKNYSKCYKKLKSASYRPYREKTLHSNNVCINAADMEVHMVADMEVDKVADKVAEMATDKN